MGLHEAILNLKHDTRMREIQLKNGTLTAEELQQYANSLPDSADNVAPLELEAQSKNDDFGGETHAAGGFAEPAAPAPVQNEGGFGQPVNPSNNPYGNGSGSQGFN